MSSKGAALSPLRRRQKQLSSHTAHFHQLRGIVRFPLLLVVSEIPGGQSFHCIFQSYRNEDPAKAFFPQGHCNAVNLTPRHTCALTCIGLQMGAKAETDVYIPDGKQQMSCGT
eukprot:746332-Hanusia_phi.AAC.10